MKVLKGLFFVSLLITAISAQAGSSLAPTEENNLELNNSTTVTLQACSSITCSNGSVAHVCAGNGMPTSRCFFESDGLRLTCCGRTDYSHEVGLFCVGGNTSGAYCRGGQAKCDDTFGDGDCTIDNSGVRDTEATR